MIIAIISDEDMLGQSTRPKQKLTYTSLIDQTTSDPPTMVVAMIEAEKLRNEAGYAYTVFAADLQLYRVILDIIWSNFQRFSGLFSYVVVYPRRARGIIRVALVRL